MSATTTARAIRPARGTRGSRVSDRAWVIGCVLLALAIRLLYVLVIARIPVGVGGDAGFYASAARVIAHGHFYERSIFSHAYQTAEHPPLYPIALAAASLLSGTSDGAFRILSCMIGSLGVGAVSLLGARIGGRRLALFAGIAAALYPPFITADGLIMSEPLFMLLTVLILLSALSLTRAPTLGRAALTGVLIGLATLTRGEGILLLVFVLAPAAWWPSAGRIMRVAVAALAVLVVLAPWVIRNAVQFHGFLIATDSNTLVAGANCHDTYYGHDIGWWSMKCLKRARGRRQLSTGDAHTSQAFGYAGAHLARLPLVGAVRLLRTFNLFQPLRQGNQEPRRRWVDVLGLIVYYPLLVLATFGLRRFARADRDRRLVILLGPVWMVAIVSVLGWGIGRFRIAADITIIILAGFALFGPVRGITSARSRR